MAEQPAQDLGVALDPWQVFQTRLEAYVSTMIDPGDQDRLTLFAPTPDDVDEVVLSVREQATALWVDYAWDGVGNVVQERADFVWRLCETVRYRYSLPHPELMTVAAEGPAAGGVGVLGLAQRGAVGPDEPSDGTGGLVWPHSHEELGDLVLAHLRQRFGPEIGVDEDGDAVVVVDGVALWVRVEESAPVVRLFTRVVDGVHSRRQTGVELNLVNRDHRWSRWVRHDRAVWQALHVPGHPFVPQVLDWMLDGFARDHSCVHHDLADRLGGRAVQ